MTYGPTFNACCIPNDIIRSFDRLRKVETGVFAALRAVVDTGADLERVLNRLRGEQKKFVIMTRGKWTGVYCV